ncbi:MAG: DUF433 domain-containing protein [Roseiflexaceae bacterium]|nr:DUF433 domain-containing protein [Roseiflexaceae bacterium]
MTAPLTTIRPLLVDEYLDIVADDDIRVKGHRIGLEHIIQRYHEGYSPEQIGLDFPGLELKAIYVIISYYLQNQGDVDAYIARLDAKFATDYQSWAAEPRSPASLRVQELRAQRERTYQL